ncbi:undecaprenyl-phosphate galactose phosphotransferase WbaP [Acinetobacter nectaris]|uniref:undecaprenyl-phosphate galactose phosphotransferase WbaP n=1 Tax=Acinetobacter nectaris TaxID=1219382 RepID=UPI001F008E54|nr:undecaprenyl-phosphate galactose phosphotransferase WbaP [Acinetobacter nectaris]MCF9045713.1 undecaprenyl-phosphate galactose phosphotransferase WbaP [Acinetobacter nectaris]
MNIKSKYITNQTALILADIVTLLFPLFFIVCINSNYQFLPTNGFITFCYIHSFITLLSIFILGTKFRHYTYRKTFWYELKEIYQVLFLTLIIEAGIASLLKLDFSRILFLLLWVNIFIFLPLIKIVVKKLLMSKNIWQRETTIIGANKNAIEAYYALTSEKNLGFKVDRFISTEPTDITHIFGIPVIHSSIENIIKTSSKHTQFVIALESKSTELHSIWLNKLMLNSFRYISIVPALNGIPLDKTDFSFIFSHDIALLRVHQDISKCTSTFYKRSFDIIVTSIIITLISPILLLLYVLVKKDGGPAFYGHERVGKFGKKFNCYKFRSMKTNSKELLEKLLETDPSARKEWDTHFKLKNDPRVTKIGAFLRKTSLDELPQLFNVLCGNMSLVGPRPITEIELKRYKDNVDYYYLAKPGITGLWQVSGRSEIDYDTRVQYDMWYVKNWSLWNDFVILLKTVKVVLARDGAY